MKISQKIIDYAIWYYLKYYPSIFKLKQKIYKNLVKILLIEKNMDE